MLARLTAIEDGITALRWHIACIEIEWRLLAAANAAPPCSECDAVAAELKAHFGTQVAKRQFDYNSIIVTLYGLLEQYVEALVKDYTGSLTGIVGSYADMPAPIRDSHVSLSLALVTRAEQSRYRGSIEPERIVENLHSCLRNSYPFTVNTEAFGHHATNFRNDAIDQIFARVGIKAVSQRIRQFSPFLEHLQGLFPGIDTNKLKPEDAFRTLNDLAERRNDVAHGSATQILSHDYLLDYISYIEAYARALLEVVQTSYLEQLALHKAIAIGKPIIVHGNRIVCIEFKNQEVAVGDLLIAKTGGGHRPFISGEIQDLEVNNVKFAVVAAADSVKAGASVLFDCRANWEFFLLRKSPPVPLPEVPEVPEVIEIVDEEAFFDAD